MASQTRSTRPAIEMSDLEVCFDGKPLLDGFALSVSAGERVILAGPSGCGKSTLLRCAMGFVVPARGRILIEGVPLTGESVWTSRTRMGYVSQEPELGGGRVRAILERPFAYRANAAVKSNLSRVPALFERFLLPTDLLDKDIGALSGGEKQRVALIGAILLDRPIYLLDEIASALDREARRTVVAFFEERADLTVLAAAHDASEFGLPGREVAFGGRAL